MNENTPAISYENIIKDKTLMPLTRALALDLMNQSYMCVGDFFKDLSNHDLQNLLDISEDEEHENFDEFALMSEMLAAGEGLTPFDGNTSEEVLDSFQLRINTFCGFIAVESLHRKGLVMAHHENMSFGPEMGTKVIVSKLND